MKRWTLAMLFLLGGLAGIAHADYVIIIANLGLVKEKENAPEQPQQGGQGRMGPGMGNRPGVGGRQGGAGAPGAGGRPGAGGLPQGGQGGQQTGAPNPGGGGASAQPPGGQMMGMMGMVG